MNCEVGADLHPVSDISLAMAGQCCGHGSMAVLTTESASAHVQPTISGRPQDGSAQSVRTWSQKFWSWMPASASLCSRFRWGTWLPMP